LRVTALENQRRTFTVFKALRRLAEHVNRRKGEPCHKIPANKVDTRS
jgi:hypothetical protein